MVDYYTTYEDDKQHSTQLDDPLTAVRDVLNYRPTDTYLLSTNLCITYLDMNESLQLPSISLFLFLFLFLFFFFFLNSSLIYLL
jgi:hypothetical protein